MRPYIENLTDVDVNVERKQAQAIASLPDSITQLQCQPEIQRCISPTAHTFV